MQFDHLGLFNIVQGTTDKLERPIPLQSDCFKKVTPKLHRQGSVAGGAHTDSAFVEEMLLFLSMGSHELPAPPQGLCQHSAT